MFYRGLIMKDAGVAVRWTSSDAIEISVTRNRDTSSSINSAKDICRSVEASIKAILPGALLEFSAVVNSQPVPFLQSSDLRLQVLSLPLIARLCRLLDPKNCFGQDWCLLAVKLNLYDGLLLKLAENSTSPVESTTHLLLKEWMATNPDTTVNSLLVALEDIERGDVAALLRKFLPVSDFCFGCALDGPAGAISPSTPSDQALSSISSSLLSR